MGGRRDQQNDRQNEGAAERENGWLWVGDGNTIEDVNSHWRKEEGKERKSSLR